MTGPDGRCAGAAAWRRAFIDFNQSRSLSGNMMRAAVYSASTWIATDLGMFVSARCWAKAFTRSFVSRCANRKIKRRRVGYVDEPKKTSPCK